jgi:hypothetical protein
MVPTVRRSGEVGLFPHRRLAAVFGFFDLGHSQFAIQGDAQGAMESALVCWVDMNRHQKPRFLCGCLPAVHPLSAKEIREERHGLPVFMPTAGCGATHRT